jgi:hypothetical protein
LAKPFQVSVTPTNFFQSKKRALFPSVIETSIFVLKEKNYGEEK